MVLKSFRLFRKHNPEFDTYLLAYKRYVFDFEIELKTNLILK